MKEIILTQNQIAFVDDKDYEYLNQWKWCAHKSCRTFYAIRNIYPLNRRCPVRITMHHEVFGKNIRIDHIDGNGCNNQIENLRAASALQNMWNQKKRKNCSSIYKGVYWDKAQGKWRAQIACGEVLNNGLHKRVYIGRFDIEEDAAREYDKFAKKHFGEFAKLNFPSDE